MVKKRVVIIGGGICGLTVLHFLKKRFNDSVDLILIEREAKVGGTIRSLSAQGALFETGPNGFLDNQPTTLELIDELGLSDQLIDANQQSRYRYIKLDGKLNQVPMDPLSFISTPLLSLKGKFHLVQGLFTKNISTDQSIHDYVTRRFGLEVSNHLIDPFMSGIYAGDIRQLHMASAFPKIFGRKKGGEKARMRSFHQGMGQMIEALYAKYKVHIQTDHEVISLDSIDADAIVLATPAYISTQLMAGINPSLSAMLNKVFYSPVAVAGFVFNKEAFKIEPNGFGYLIPSNQGQDVLGVLIESNVFADRSTPGQLTLRVMLGGMHHPSIINDSPEQILAKALREIDSTYGLLQSPQQTFIKIWPKAIPQYDLNYPSLRKTIAQLLLDSPSVQLCANYLDGVSMNDCINNAKYIAGIIRI